MNTMFRLLATLGLLALSAVCLAQPEKLQIESGLADSAKEFGSKSIDELLAQFSTPGVSVAFFRNFEIEWAQGYGVADVISAAPVTPETLFQAASISKPVNAMAVLKAAEEGRLDMDADINEALTAWQLPDNEYTVANPVTPRMLSAHVAGLGDGFGFPGYSPGVELPTLVDIFDGGERANVSLVRVVRPPMTAYHYSGGGVTILQQALIDIYQRDYATLLHEMVLGPIGMTQSTFAQPLPEHLHAQASRAHSFAGGAMQDVWHVYPEQAAAGLWTTPSDLARFAIEVQRSYRNESNRVLNQVSTSQMLSPVGVGSFGVGFSLNKAGEGWYFNHGGSNFGFQAQLTAHKVKGYGYAIMTNAPGGRVLIQELARRIEQAYEFDSLAQPVPR